MSVDIAGRLDLPPGQRLAWHAFHEEHGEPPAVVWQVPGTVTLLADGPLRLTVATPWTVIAAAGPRQDGRVELTKMEHPDQRVLLTVREAAAGLGPRWAGTGLRHARDGVNVVVKSELPEGTGVGVRTATETAIRLSLTGATADEAPLAATTGMNRTAAHVIAGDRQVPFDLAAAGLRLMLIDTRIRGAERLPVAEVSPVGDIAELIDWADIPLIGSLLTVAHGLMTCHEAQQIAVRSALRAGAIGGRALIDGQGRPAIALVPVGRLAQVRAALCAAFADRGLRSPRLLTFTPAAGPLRVW